jgi:hypothetical protein
MSNGSFGNSSDPISRSRNWDHPNGLGWQVWRRAQSTGLLTQPIQRDLARFRANTFRSRVPLLADIQRRWALTSDPVVNRFSLNLPLLWVHPRIFRDSPSPELPALAAWSLPPHPEPSVAFPAVELSPLLSARTEFPKAMMTKGRERASKEVVVQRNVQSSDLVDVKSDVRPDSSFDPFGSIARSLLPKSDPQTSKGFSFTKEPIQSSDETLTALSIKPFGGDNSRINAYKRFLIPSQLSAGRFIASGHTPLLRQSLMPQRLVRQDVQYLPLSSRITLLPAVFRQQDRQISGSLHGSGVMLPRTDHSLRLRSASVPLLSFARSNDFDAKITGPLSFPQLRVRNQAKTVARHEVGTQPWPLETTRPQSAAGLGIEHRTLTTNHDLAMIRRQEEGPLQRQNIVMDTAVQRSGIVRARGALSATAVRLPLSVGIWRYDKRIPLSAQQPDLKFSKTASGFDFPLLASKAGSIPPIDLSAHDNESTMKVVAAQNVAETLVRPQPSMVEDGERSAPHSLAARSQSAEYKVWAAKPLPLTNTVGQRTALTTIPQLAVSREKDSSQPRQSEPSGIPVRHRYDEPGATWRASTTILASTARGVGQPLSRNDSESDRTFHNRITEPHSQEGSNTFQLFTSPDAMLNRFYSGPGVWAGHRVGDPRVSSRRTSLARAPAGMISLVTLPLNTAQSYVVPGETRGGHFDLSGDGGESGISWSGIARASFGLTENDSESGLAQKRLLLTDSWPTRRRANLTSTLSEGRLVIPTAPPLLRLADIGRDRDQQPSIMQARDAALDMPLAPLLRTESRDDLTLHYRVNGAVVQTISAGLGKATGASGGAPAALVGGGEPKAIGTEKGASAAPIDLDELVEKAWQKLMRKLTIEQERRGYSRWA